MALEDTDTSNFKISYKTLYIGGTITLGLVIIFILIANFWSIHYEIRDIVAMITCGIVSTTLIYHAKNLKLNFEANKEKLEFDKQKFEEEKSIKEEESRKAKTIYSFEASTLWFKPDMARNVELSRKYLLENKDKLMHGPVIDVIKGLDEDVETRKSVVCVLNYFENLSLMIKNNIVDEDSIKNCFKTVFLDYFKVLRLYIDEVQKTSARYLMNYEDIAKKWDKN